MTQTLKPHPQSGGPGADLSGKGLMTVSCSRRGTAGGSSPGPTRGSANLVREPQQFEGGLLRTMLAPRATPARATARRTWSCPAAKNPIRFISVISGIRPISSPGCSAGRKKSVRGTSTDCFSTRW